LSEKREKGEKGHTGKYGARVTGKTIRKKKGTRRDQGTAAQKRGDEKQGAWD